MAGKAKYDWDDIIPAAERLLRAGEVEPTQIALADHFDIPRSTMRQAMNLRGLTVAKMGKLHDAGFADEAKEQVDDDLAESKLKSWEEWKTQEAKRPDWRELVEHAINGADLEQRMNPKYDFVERIIETDKPVAVAAISDLHLGSPATDYVAFLDTADFLREQPDVYFLAAGLDPEYAIKQFRSAEPILSQVLSPQMQVEAQYQWLESMLPKLLAGCWDNHKDERLERELGDFTDLAWPKEAPYFHAKGLLKIHVGDAEYQVAMTHRHKGSSIYHDLQPVFRLFRDFYPADICITAHTHRPAYARFAAYGEMRRLMGKPPETHFVVTGTFKTGHDNYSERNFKGRGILGVPTLVLFPDKHKTVYFSNPEDAVAYMRGI